MNESIKSREKQRKEAVKRTINRWRDRVEKERGGKEREREGRGGRGGERERE